LLSEALAGCLQQMIIQTLGQIQCYTGAHQGLPNFAYIFQSVAFGDELFYQVMDS
jgi:hypothetical protein